MHVFDTETRDSERDIGSYIKHLDACKSNSPYAGIFVIIDKMDLVYGGKKEKDRAFNLKKNELDKYSESILLRVFATSIYMG